ncbi:MAG: hypothetical protein DWQ07_22590 [Chloroflexi bacterium]|nr:MAG: hypothetical protein DWQ07_22590 [Chloroflexota bacterium]MBL1193937.1 hypothetical protein [Chloroflexota bacterium]NOH11231.1 tetratricopeptide repeat protein [Chloroflexota bacterium]
MKLSGERDLFRRKPRSYNLLFVLLGLNIAVVIWAVSTLQGIQTGDVETWFAATPTATRAPSSYLQEGIAAFETGDLQVAINAFQDALAVDPENVAVLTDLARIQTYSARLLTPGQQVARLEEARINIDRAVELGPLDSNAHAVRALALDWSASIAAENADQRQDYLIEAGQAATRALQLDPQNVLALAYQAEVLIDQQQWVQAEQTALEALDRDPNLMDTNRVYALVLESTGAYSAAIEYYKEAARINPNLTFLYISIGQMYRQLLLYDEALDYFDQAASINETLGIGDPLPYIAIAKTYSREGQFFAAAINAERAIAIDPENPDVYGQLGIIRFRARNYEGAIPVLQCAIEGCVAAENAEFGTTVTSLPLAPGSLEYYLTYSSVLAAFGICDSAEPLFVEVRELFPGDAISMAVIAENQAIIDGFRAQDACKTISDVLVDN